MIELEIQESKRKISMPEHLGECDSRQYAEACHLIYKFQQRKISYFDFRVEMVYKLLDLKRGKSKLKEAEVDDMHSNIYRLSQLIDSFFEKDEEKRLIIRSYYINNHSPVITDSFRRFRGPADSFDDVTFGQYLDGLNLYHFYQKDPSEELLYMLMATFYFRRWEKYDSRKVEQRAKEFKKIFFGRVFGFYLFFASFQKYITGAKIIYQGDELDLSILFSKNLEATEERIPGLGMLSVAHQLAESGVYGPMKEVRQANMWEIMLQLYDIRKRDLDRKEAQRKEEQKARVK